MKVIALVVLMGLILMALESGWVFLIVPLACAVVWIVNSDKNGAMIESFFAGCFGLIILGGIITIAKVALESLFGS